MKITMSFDVADAEDLAEARAMFDRLRWVGKGFGDDQKADTPPPPTTGSTPPPPSDTPPPPSDTPPPPDVELDIVGHAWSAEFHVASKNKLKSGEWKRKRGVKQEDVVAAAKSAAPAAPTTVIPPTTPPAPTPPTAEDLVLAGPPTWQNVIAAFNARSAKYTQEQLQAGMRAAMVEPTTLFEAPEQYAAAIAALDAACPL